MMQKTVESLLGDPIRLKNNLIVPAWKFSELFVEAENISYDELMRIDAEKEYGYSRYIEEWKERGLIG